MQVRCPICGKKEDVEYCVECETNLKSIQLAYKRSQFYYINAYKYAKQRNFEQATKFLQKSILFNKENIEAKNLLGLIHFEMGEVGEALKLWILSISISKKDNIAGEYIERLRKKPRKFEEYKESIRLYNKSLGYLENKNEDVAIIRLKKAINLNANFVEARNLLAASYIAIGQIDKALIQIQETLEIDESNVKALSYLNAIERGKTIESTQGENLVDTPNINQGAYYYGMKPQKVINRGGVLGRCMLYFILGVLCMFVAQVGLVIPSKTGELEKRVYKLTHENSNMKLQMDTFTEKYREEIIVLEKANSELQEEVDSARIEITKADQERKLAQVELYIQQREWTSAAFVLNNILESSLSDQQKVSYSQFKEAVYPQAASILYKQGYNNFMSQKYMEANSALEKVIIYAPTSQEAANALYYRGEIAEKNNDEAKAIQHYESVVRGHEGTNAAYKAQKKLEQLKPS